MAYQVIARKYRPQAFSELVGQKHVTQTLTNALNAQRFPHAILFNGPRGTGKTTSARIIAKILLCQNLQESRPCHECQNCQDVTLGRHLDVLEIDGASHNGVDSVRELRETLGFMPSSGAYKIYIIDEVHMLSTSAFNALLKTLEEPPAHIIFIFATTEIHKIPITILSRCQRYDFRTLPLVDIQKHLKEICTKEGVTADPTALWLLAKQAKGSIRDSLTLLDQVISFGQNSKNTHTVTPETVTEVLGLSDRSLLFKLLRTLAQQDQQGLGDGLKQFLSSGSDPILFVQDFLELLRHCFMTKINLSQQIMDWPKEEVTELQSIIAPWQPEDLQLLFDVTLAGIQKISLSHEPGMALEMLMFKLLSAPRLVHQGFIANSQQNSATPSHESTAPQNKIRYATQASPSQGPEPSGQHNAPLPRTPSPQQPNKGQHNNNFQNQGTYYPQTQPPHSSPATQSPPSSPPKVDSWESFIEAVKTSNGFLGALLENTTIHQQNSEQITLGLPKKMSFLLDKLQDEKNLERIRKFLQNLWKDQRTVSVILLTGNEDGNLSPKAKKKLEQQSKEQKDKEDIKSHPLVKKTEALFKGQITHVRNMKPSTQANTEPQMKNT